jgi:uncharacterized phage protein (TIGR01671 family)
MKHAKFRAWDNVNKQMFDVIKMTFSADGIKVGVGYISNPNCGITYRKDIILIQFTGLIDKNGVEVYEGDIVNVLNYLNGEIWEGHTHYDEVVFLNGRFDIKNPWCHESLQSNTVEVIGNIHENPELLS